MLLNQQTATEIEINPVYYPYLNSTARYEIFYGGAGSGKSYFVAQKKVIQHLRDTGRKTLIVRKVKSSIRNTVFAQIREVVDDFGVRHKFEIPKGTAYMDIRGPNGNEFLFTGLDDPEKIKSIAGITDIWIEEPTELTADDFKQLDLRLRGRSDFTKQITLTFNPISALHWIKGYFFDIKRDNCSILKTTYKDNLFIDDEYKQQLESYKEIDYIYYQIYALGEWGVLGNLIFNNYIIEDIPTEIENYGSIYQGIDFGFNDPSAYIKVGLKDDELYILDEMYLRGMTNNELIKCVGDKMGRGRVIADSSEPDRVKEFKQAGYDIVGAEKGPGSVKAGLDWAKRKRIHIHPNCTNFIKEIQGYKYREDKDGNVYDEPVDINNHLMDALRYALEPLRNERRITFSSSRGLGI